MLGLDYKMIRLRIYLTKGCIYAWFRFYNDNIENIPNLELGKFDFIESTGTWKTQ